MQEIMSYHATQGTLSDVRDPALADASSLAGEFSLKSDPSAFLVNLR